MLAKPLAARTYFQYFPSYTMLKGEFNLDIMSQSGYWSYISANDFHPLVVAFCTLVKKL